MHQDIHDVSTLDAHPWKWVCYYDGKNSFFYCLLLSDLHTSTHQYISLLAVGGNEEKKEAVTAHLKFVESGQSKHFGTLSVPDSLGP